MLEVLADVLRRNTRGEDLVLRWGAEEFVRLLYGLTLDEARHVVAQLRTKARDRGYESVAWPLTVSAGLAGGSGPDGDNLLPSWLEAVDQVLLRAEQAGRDRVEVTWAHHELN